MMKAMIMKQYNIMTIGISNFIVSKESGQDGMNFKFLAKESNDF
jgi:hypothetical protein